MGRWPRGKPLPLSKIRRWVEGELRSHLWIAEKVGCNPETVRVFCHENGLRVQSRGPRKGPGHPEWKGGRIVDKDGYVLIWVWEHPHARQRGQKHHGGHVLEHRLVMELHLGRFLKRHEVVHHKNADKQDNRLENLVLFPSNGEHLRHELTWRCPKWTEDGKRRLKEAYLRGLALYRPPKRRKPT
jgi:hypothetical protein